MQSKSPGIYPAGIQFFLNLIFSLCSLCLRVLASRPCQTEPGRDKHENGQGQKDNRQRAFEKYTETSL
jgi:hypothetical protein